MMAQTSSTRNKTAMSLENFMRQATSPSGKPILDPYSFYMTDINYYMRDRQGTTRLIDRSSAGAPDLISWMQYGTHEYWWLLCLVNIIIYGEKEIIPNMLFFLPRIPDVHSFMQQFVNRRRGEKIVRLGVTPGAENTSR
jgi:hypothetical protein